MLSARKAFDGRGIAIAVALLAALALSSCSGDSKQTDAGVDARTEASASSKVEASSPMCVSGDNTCGSTRKCKDSKCVDLYCISRTTNLPCLGTPKPNCYDADTGQSCDTSGGSTGGSSGGDPCSLCLDACHGISGCCTGTGCICDSACS
jgi:hypothetical protein